MENIAKPFARSIHIPSCPIELTLTSSSEMKSDKDKIQLVEFKIKNTGTAKAVSQATSLKFSSGEDDSCLFWEKKAMADGDDFANKTGQLKTFSSKTDAVMRTVDVPSETSDKIMRTAITVKGVQVYDDITDTYLSPLSLDGGEEITLKISGRLYSQAHNGCFVEWTQFWEGDSWSDSFDNSRV